MKRVSMRPRYLFLPIFLLYSIIYAEQHVTFCTNQSHQAYAHITNDIRSITCKVDSSMIQDKTGLIALSSSLKDELEYMPLELMMCAVQEMRLLTSLTPEESRIIETYYKQLMDLNEKVVFDEETVRKRCKTFNELCVRGNARIGGNLIVCGTICPGPRITIPRVIARRIFSFLIKVTQLY